jgi:hypothetical protein
VTSLYIQAEAGGPAWQVWPASEAIPEGAVREASSYLFELRDNDKAIGADLFIDDVPVDALRSRESRTARWRWSPGFHAGTVEAVLRVPDAGLHRFEIITDPDLRKLTRDHFDAMVREILEDTYALFSISAFRKGIARQRANRPPPIARLEFLRSRVDEITASVDAIARTPRHFLRAHEITVPIHRAMRATGLEIIKSFRSGAIRTEVGNPSRLPATLRGKLPAQVRLRQRRNSVDIPEHRQIKACLKSWSAWLGGIADVLAKVDASSEPDDVSAARGWSIRSRKIAGRLSDAANKSVFAEVGEDKAFLHMSSLFRNDPIYGRFYKLWQDMNLGLAALFGDFLQMPLAKTYKLYELWCFLRLLRAALEEYGSHGVDLSSLFIAEAAGGVSISSGAVVVNVNPHKALCFQRQYREYWLDSKKEGSYSRTMVPDVVLSNTGSGDADRSIIVLDAKYRISDGLNDALSSIHMYRDALVQEVETGKTEGIVSAAYLLTPHLPSLGGDFKDTQMPGRLFHPAYREKFQFGAVTLRPGMTTNDLRATLRAIVADAVA